MASLFNYSTNMQNANSTPATISNNKQIVFPDAPQTKLPNVNTGFNVSVPKSVNAGSLSANTNDNVMNIAEKSAERESILSRVMDTYNTRPNVGSNKNFINASYVSAFGKDAPADVLDAYYGRPVSEVVRAFGLDPNFGVPPEQATPVVEQAPTQQQQNTQKYQQAQQAVKDTTQNIAKETRDLAQNKRTAYQTIAQDQGVQEKADIVTQKQNELAQLRTQLADLGVMQYAELAQIGDKPIHSGIIQGQKAIKSREQKLDTMLAQNAYNNKLLEVQIAQGAYENARNTAKEIANDQYEAGLLEIEALKIEGSLSEKEAEDAKALLEERKELLLEGYVPVESPELYAPGEVIEISGQYYLTPEAEVKTEVVTANGQKILINKQTGETIKVLGSSTTGTGTASNISANFKFSSSEVQKLMPYFSNEEIQALEGDIKQLGFQTALNGVDSQAGKKILQEMFGITDNSKDVNFYVEMLKSGSPSYFKYDEENDEFSINWASVPADLRPDVYSLYQSYLDSQTNSTTKNKSTGLFQAGALSHPFSPLSIIRGISTLFKK